MKNDVQYTKYKKPKWAPPSWLFSPVWLILYTLIVISYSYVGYQVLLQTIPAIVMRPFILNLIFNAAFTYIQFRLKNFQLALVDILLVDATLVWALIAIYPYAPWVTYINLPYLAWVIFATVLQVSVTILNSKAAK